MNSFFEKGAAAKSFIEENFSDELKKVFDEVRHHAFVEGIAKAQAEIEEERIKSKEILLEAEQLKISTEKESKKIRELYKETVDLVKRLKIEVEEEIFLVETESLGFFCRLFNDLLRDESFMVNLLQEMIDKQKKKYGNAFVKLELPSVLRSFFSCDDDDSTPLDIVFLDSIDDFTARLVGNDFFIEISPDRMIRDINTQLKSLVNEV
ncbi:hypothetical protein K6Y31_20300 [Motilimonas cestriensis]|uniref:Uncharacterized protein n=1 Tax=Motilimonas cestriensis TaxID=2742685 RepID=A0ABS8WDJ5_9GAMM|nr:hypothetical protein [Motilimonas cestriensis]MCE2597119.1 hypothetical protein [Motilimonas cestriensis]